MRIGIIGTGVMGKNHIRIYSDLRGVDELLVYDNNENSIHSLNEFDLTICESLEQLINCSEAVSICVPTQHHFTVARSVIEENVPCLIEKPITSSADEAKELVSCLQGRKLVVGVGHVERFNPVVAEIAKIIENPFFVEARRHNPSSLRITDSSVVEDLMIHDVDIVFNVLFDRSQYAVYSAGNENVCKAVITFEGSIVSLSASRLACKKTRSIYIEDEQFTVEGDLMTQEVYRYNRPEKFSVQDEKYRQENIVEKVLVNKVEPLALELRTFVNCVRRGVEFPVTPRQALANMAVCQQIQDVLKRKQPLAGPI